MTDINNQLIRSHFEPGSTQQPVQLPPVARPASRQQLRNPLSYFLDLASGHGDLVCYRVTPEPAFLVNHPLYARHILIDNHHNYTKETSSNQMFKKAIGDGLVTSEGERWRWQRRLMQPAFHHSNLARMDETITEIVGQMLQRWQMASRQGTPIRVSHEMSELTLRITTNLLFGVDLGKETEGIDEAVNLGAALLERPSHPRFQAGMALFANIVDQIISQHRQSPGDSHDVLSILIATKDQGDGSGMDDRQIREQVITLLMAGYETTASALAWSLYLLAQNPEVMAALRSEVRQVLNERRPGSNDLPRLEYTQMVFKETLRLYPPAWVIGRKAIDVDRFGDFELPSGGVIAISPYTLHRHPQFWQEPEIFDPHRFSAARTAGLHRYAYLPFGAGPRKCIGNNLAMLEAVLTIAMIAQRFNLSPAGDEQPQPEAIYVLRPDSNMRIMVEPLY